jgi:hypothetical protein
MSDALAADLFVFPERSMGYDYMEILLGQQTGVSTDAASMPLAEQVLTILDSIKQAL